MDTKSLQNELDELASRYGISAYVFMHSSPESYGHIGGNVAGSGNILHTFGLIEAVRLGIKGQLIREINGV